MMTESWWLETNFLNIFSESSILIWRKFKRVSAWTKKPTYFVHQSTLRWHSCLSICMSSFVEFQISTSLCHWYLHLFFKISHQSHQTVGRCLLFLLWPLQCWNKDMRITWGIRVTSKYLFQMVYSHHSFFRPVHNTLFLWDINEQKNCQSFSCGFSYLDSLSNALTKIIFEFYW